MRQANGIQSVRGGVLKASLAAFLAVVISAISGCGAGGYPGGGITAISAAAVTIDAGQSYPVSVTTISGTTGVTWHSACSRTGCGTVTTTGANTAIYTAPSGLTAPMTVMLSAVIPNTSQDKTITITVNPDPVINGLPPAGTVGVAYSTTLTATGGTAPLSALHLTDSSLPPGLSFNASTGVISGTPTVAGVFTVTVQTTDSSAIPFTVTTQETIVISAPGSKLVFISGNPPNATVGTPYSYPLQAGGGTAPYTYGLTGGALPAGLTLGPNGVISGTPTTPGTYNFTVQVTDATGATATANFTMTVAAGGSITLTTGTLPTGTVNLPYSATIGVSGGISPYSCTIVSGTLQAGLTLSANGCVITGTPTVASTVILSVTAKDGSNPVLSVTGTVSLTINPAPLTITTGTLPSGTVGTPYSQTIGVSGGTAPYSCSIASGTLQAGLTLGANCVVSGTPTAPGTNTISVTATDSSSPTKTVTSPVALTINPAALTITTGTLPSGTVGTPYSQMIGVSGGTAPYSCSIASGTLQPGLTLGANCVVSGTPTAPGTNTISVIVTDTSSPAKTVTGPVKLTINPAGLSLTTGTLPSGTVNVAYNATIGVAGGTAPYSCSITSGTLQAGLTLGANCVVSGTPTTSGTVTLGIHATDAGNPQQSTDGTVSLTINPATLTITTGTLPNGTVGTPYSQTIGVSGGTGPYSCTIASGTLQPGLTLGANCTVSGTPTAPGADTISVTVTDSGNPAKTVTNPVALTINPAPLTITTGTLPNGTVGTPYSQMIGVSGGTAPYSCSIASGTLQPGLTLGANCVVSGTPTAPGTNTISVTVTDTSSPTKTVTGPVALTINPAALTITTGTLPNGTVGTPYSQMIGVSGGTAPYSCSIASGTLQPGLTLGANCVVSGTPTAPGTNTISVTVTDTSSPTKTVTGPVALTINPAALTITTGTLPNGTVGTPYSQMIGVSGGTAPYSCSIASGTLQPGLTLGANCVVSGTPTAPGTNTISVTVTDTSSPTKTVTGPVALTINPAALTITTGTLPNGTVGTPYSQMIGVSGGTAPYSCSIASGTLQPGLTLGANCVVSGTPTAPGTNTISVTVTDTSSPTKTVTGPVALTINPAALTITTGTLPNGTVGTPYNQMIGVTGGTAPYSCSVTSGTLQAGLTLGANCVVSGTPTTSGTVTLGIHATDAGNPQQSTNGTVSLTINPATITLTLSSPPNGTAGTPYTGTIGVSGGTGPYSCQITAGTLPTGLTLGANCVITGTTTVSGPVNITVKATDSSSPSNTTTGAVSFTIAPAGGTLTLSSPPAATVQTPYTGTIGVTGGTGPYTCSIPAGTLPAGLTNNGCVITGTPTTPGTTTVSVTTTDSSNPTITTTAPVQIVVNPLPALTFTGSLPSATVNVPYMQTLSASGGLAPYTYAVTAGTLPAGITVSSSGVVSGTPTTVGAYSFTVTATDSENPTKSVPLPLILVVKYPPTPPDGALIGPYAFLFQGYDDALIGVLPYKTATIGSFTADGKGGITLGEQDENHQTTSVTGTTVSTQGLIGTYTLGTDYRGSLTLTRLNADGTVGTTTTYAIAVKAPVSPATQSTSGSIIESDDNQLRGTKVSGTFLAQTSTAFTTGLNGSYAFGIGGDTPCLVACSVNLGAGPVAEVGQFAVSGGNLLGTGDANVAATNLASANLSGTYGTADNNGRLALSLTTAGETPGYYPTDYAVYLVDATHAFVMSTDKHSQYILLAGSMEQQTQVSFSNASMTGAFVGYENAATNPGLVGATLTQVASLSTATIFQGTDKGDGTCNINSVDTGGVNSLVSGLTGIVGNLTSLTSLLGAYSTTGATTCGVSSIGRGILAYPPDLSLLGIQLQAPPAPRVFYLSSTNHGYFLETGYAGLGNLENQTGTPFTLANTFTGTYVYESLPAASAASIETSGVIVSNGAGSATSTLDTNIGVGTLNVIQLGNTQTSTYTAPDANGRFTLNNTTVIYAITRNRFVLLDTNALTTSPSVTLLY